MFPFIHDIVKCPERKIKRRKLIKAGGCGTLNLIGSGMEDEQ